MRKPAFGRDGRHREGRHFDTVADRVVVRTGQPVHALDDDFPVGIDLNEGAHLLQEQAPYRTISGSTAALWITVVPSARHAAKIAFSVAPTLG